MYNYYKTNQARQMREYMDARIKEVEKEMESMKKDFIKFQRKNNYYDPDRQLESTIRYMANMQTEREAIKQEISYELAKQGTRTKRVEDLERRLKNLESAISQVTDGKQSDMGVVALNKTPELSNQYLKLKSELQMQQAIYVMLREQREQLDMEANNKQVNLIVLQPPWENDKRVFPKRGLMMMFTFFISFLVATLLCSFIEYMRSESKKGSEISYEWESIVREICFWRK
jgi:capsule polysaccharide export protein KpsE/RkpR